MSNRNREAESPSPDTLPMQPRPMNTMVVHALNGDRVQTAIARTWAIEDAERCRLCSVCIATAGKLRQTAMCLLVAPGLVDEADAARFGIAPGRRDDRRNGAAS